jgi:hypothetical protein
MIGILTVVFFSLLLVGLALVIHGTVVRNKWGVNLRGSHCPRCNSKMPSVRVPKSSAQTLWGGSTCCNCGCEVDKWGREIPK